MSPPLEIQKAISTWNKYNRDGLFKEELEQFQKDGNDDALLKAFSERLEFGTAGLRGRMGCGFNAMNDVVVIQAAQGLLAYTKSTVPNAANRGIIIGYDGRYYSRRFAELTAAIFLHGSFKVYLYSSLCPTPLIPFGIKKFQCAVGVMVTASHNPKQDNGYKVYWENGSQIISPVDKGIREEIMKNLEPRESSWDVEILKEHENLFDPLEEVFCLYIQRRKETTFSLDMNARSNFKFVYTAMHGVGYNYVVEVFKQINLKPPIPVVEQMEPDPEFPTVKFPNPEEGKSALNLSIETADKSGATIILANDPDADRFALAEKLKSTSKWKVYTGNEIGTLFGWWLLEEYKSKNPNKTDFSNVYFIYSTVSSKILRTIAKAEKMGFEETLTGFKWMGSSSDIRIKNNQEVIFAFEESIGFMCDVTCLDKDGVSAAAKMAELIIYLDNNGKTAYEKLQEIYDKYGHHLSEDSYYFCNEKVTVNKIFERLRTWLGGREGTYPESIIQGKYKISAVRDLTFGFDSSQPNNKPILPVSKSSQMITFSFENGLVFTLRTSGTEPKIKYYGELVAPPTEKSVTKLAAILREMINALVEEFLEPSKNKLVPKEE